MVIIGNGVRTIMETAKMRWFGFPMKMVDVDSAIESYKMQMQYLIPVITNQHEFKCHLRSKDLTIATH